MPVRRGGAKGRATRRALKDESDVSPCIKWLLFGFNLFFWFLGTILLLLTIWAWMDDGTIKEFLDNFKSLIGVSWLQPIYILLAISVIMFLLGFFGCIGALRESALLLKIYYIVLAIILVIIIGGGVCMYAFKGKVEKTIKNKLLDTIEQYMDDEGLQGLIDWTQLTWLKCCGVDGPDDWDNNIYYNCSSIAAQACGVPYSCCQEPKIAGSDTYNTYCGYNTRVANTETTTSEVIWTTGCYKAGKDWLNKNIIPIASGLIGTALVMNEVLSMHRKQRNTDEQLQTPSNKLNMLSQSFAQCFLFPSHLVELNYYSH